MGNVNSTVNVNLNVDVVPTNPPPPAGLNLNADGLLASFQAGSGGGRSVFLQNQGNTAAVDFSGITAGQMLLVFANVPVQIVITQNALQQTLYGTMFLLTQPDAAHALTAAVITALSGNTTVLWEVAG